MQNKHLTPAEQRQPKRYKSPRHLRQTTALDDSTEPASPSSASNSSTEDEDSSNGNDSSAA